MFDDAYFMKKALVEANVAFDMDEIPIGAVVVCQNQIIARAHNLTEQLTDVTAHAEMQAITAAASYLGAKYLNDCILYVTVEPCVMCAGALYWSKVAKVVYGASEDKYGYTKKVPLALHSKTEVVAGVMADECAQIMKDFFITKR